MAYPEKKERNKEIYKKHKQGLSYKEIGDFYHIDKAAVWRIVKRMKALMAGDNSVDA